MSDKTKTDEADVLAQNEKLTADLAAANATIARLKGELSAAQGEAGRVAKLEADLKAANDAAAATAKERDALKGDNDALKGKMADFDRAVAAELAKRGISAEAVKPTGDAKAAVNPTDLISRYDAVKNDPKARAEFLKEHGEKLRAILR